MHEGPVHGYLHYDPQELAMLFRDKQVRRIEKALHELRKNGVLNRAKDKTYYCPSIVAGWIKREATQELS